VRSSSPRGTSRTLRTTVGVGDEAGEAGEAEEAAGTPER
jgi:hypothetical protein